MNLNGLEYHLETDGHGSPLLMLHGFMGSSDSWSSIRRGLAERFQLLMPDLVGHGQTAFTPELTRYDMSSVGHDLALLMGDAPFNLLGYSMGGRLALYFAIHYPHLIRKLIIISGSPGLANADQRMARRQADDALADRMDAQSIEQVVAEWERLPLWQSSTFSQLAQAQLRAVRLAQNPRGLALSLRGMGTGVQPPLWEQLHQVSMPTLLMVGEQDTKFVQIAHQMMEHLPHASLEIIPNVGHSVSIEAPQLTLASVVRFLEDDRGGECSSEHSPR
ncbi:MAG: 2-succinyl-6-hydroxy-2,4-cyclohexadiene-1-carboxylate synthase [Phototrophicaceae bacterium]